MTLISIVGLVGRAIGRVLTSSLGWGTSLLYGRVPKDHQRFVEAMFGASLLWGGLAIVTLLPPVLSFVLQTTPFVQSVGLSILRTVIVAGLVLLPLLVGLCSILVPADANRPRGLAIVGHLVRGYPLALLLVLMFLFLPLAGAARRVGSLRRGWADLHIPILVKPGRYDSLLDEVDRTLRQHDLVLERHPAPRFLELPGRVLALIAGRDVGDLLPDRLIELRGDELEVGVYPSDLAISGRSAERLRARSALMTSLADSSVHLTTSAESQKVEDLLEVTARVSTPTSDALAEIAAMDGELARLDVPSEDWEILFRLRLQAERDVLRRIARPDEA